MLATLAGLAAAVWAFGSAGFANVLGATARIGPDGFAIFCLYSLVGFVPLGAAWLAATPGEPGSRVWLFSWARILREAVADLLPFSQIGGIVIGTRSLMQAGIAPTRVYASLVVDMTTEMAAQLVFTVFGLALMASILTGNDAAALRPLILGGTATMIAVMAAFFLAQRPALAFAERIAGHLLPGTMSGLLDALRATYAARGRVIAAFAFNLLGWVASAFGAWLVLHLMGARISVWSVLSLESLIFTLRSVIFFIPAAIGIQETTYALAAPLFGLPVEMALALSLVKRARELVIGLPTLLVWQAKEARAMLVARARLG